MIKVLFSIWQKTFVVQFQLSILFFNNISISSNKINYKMATLCPSNYIPSNISTSMDEIQLSLKNVSSELQKIYNQPDISDFAIKLQDKQFFVHRFVLEKHSVIFCKGVVRKNGSRYIFDWQNKAKKQLVEKILSYLYGYTITIRRCQIQHAYQICKTLYLEELLNIFHLDMLNHFDEYDIFPLLKLATQSDIANVKQMCYDQLEIEQYEPMRYNKSGLLILDQELFKVIVKRHNFQKQHNQKFGLSFNEINTLVQDYCQMNGLKGKQKDLFVSDIEEKQNQQYTISFNNVLKKNLTPRRVKSSSQIFFRNTLTLPREKESQQNSSFQLWRHRKDNNKSTNESDIESEQQRLSPFLARQKNKIPSQERQKSISNYSTDNKSFQNRSRKQSFGSVQSISDPKIIMTISQISENQKAVNESSIKMKIKAQEILKRLKNEQETQRKAHKLDKMHNLLEEIQAQVKGSNQKLEQLQKTLDNMQKVQHKKQIKRKFNEMFETSIALDLTVSTEFGMKNKLNACKK